MAFASSTFLGATSLKGVPRQVSAGPATGASGLRAAVSKPSGRSKIWEQYLAESRKTPVTKEARKVTRSVGENALRAASTPFFREFSVAASSRFGAGGDARTVIQRKPVRIADDYMADCARRQYIMTTNASGVYAPMCTEGGAKFAAEDARVAALAARFRAKQVPSVVSFADFYENRRRATVLARGCGYEEALAQRFGASAAAVVVGNSEKSAACVRYADPQSVAEKYMADSVSRASSTRATLGGLYGVMCNDGTVKDAAEAKRVTALAVQYRNKQRSQLAKEAAKFEVAKYARENFAKIGSYEEDMFNKYPATAAAMRPDNARY